MPPPDCESLCSRVAPMLCFLTGVCERGGALRGDREAGELREQRDGNRPRPRNAYTFCFPSLTCHSFFTTRALPWRATQVRRFVESLHFTMDL